METKNSYLEKKENGLCLVHEWGDLYFDFVNDKRNYHRPLPQGKKEIIAKAIGLSKGYLDIIDATAGMAVDTIVMARLGACVRAIERSHTIYQLLMDAKVRAQGKVPWIENIEFIHGDAISILNNLSDERKPDVIYLDPMFPEKKKDALPKKEMRIFKDIVGEDNDSIQLLNAALGSARERVVVKRPLKAQEIHEPVHHSFVGHSVRYDMYLIKKEV